MRTLIIAACLVLSVVAVGCASHRQQKPASSGDAKQDVKQECQRVANEAVRLRNGAVSAYNSGRRDAALTLFDQSINSWREITSGALRCDPDAVTSAYESLDKVMRERDETNRMPR